MTYSFITWLQLKGGQALRGKSCQKGQPGQEKTRMLHSMLQLQGIASVVCCMADLCLPDAMLGHGRLAAAAADVLARVQDWKPAKPRPELTAAGIIG